MKAEGALRVVDDEPEGQSPEEQQERLLEQVASIIGGLQSKVDDAIHARAEVEKRWMRNLRAYHGRYDETTQGNLEGSHKSQAFINFTRHKTNGWAARLSDLLFPTDERNWGIKPTPLPKLSQAAKDAVEAARASVEDANAAEQANAPGAELLLQQADAFARKARETEEEIAEARKRCDAMQEAINDQLVECNYQQQCRDAIEDGCRVGTGILKGPLTSQKLRSEWREDGSLGRFVLATLPDPMPDVRRVDYWHFFPDPSASRIGEAEYTFERHLPTKKDLRRMALKLGFSRSAIKRLLAEGTDRTVEHLDHINQLRELIGEGPMLKDRYLMWEYHGTLECDDVALLLRASGDEEAAREWEEEKDPFQEYRVILYFCRNELLKISPDYPLDSGESLYSVWNFERGETGIWGFGVPDSCYDSQAAMNSAWRMMLDNAALSVGPQVVVDKAQIQPTNGKWELEPNKVWERVQSAVVPGQADPFEVHNIPNNQEQLGGIINLATQFIDQETSMPTIAQGEQGAATQTLGGMSILMNSGNVVFRRVVKSWDDDVTSPTVRRLYDWNMQFNPDENIKGDMQVDARGSSVLLVREIQSQNLLNVVTNWSVHQALAPWLKVRESMAKALQTMMITPDEVLLTQDEFDQKQEQAAAAAAQTPPPPSPEEVRMEVAKLDQQTRMEVANIQREVALIRAEADTGLKRDELMTKAGIEREKITSAERQKAVDIAVEDRRAKEAAAQGETATEARGKEIG